VIETTTMMESQTFSILAGMETLAGPPPARLTSTEMVVEIRPRILTMMEMAGPTLTILIRPTAPSQFLSMLGVWPVQFENIVK
tara:strand:- start:518 stop:766 length:249 start_codon:yes stop_codon:yes gene_type:complete